MQEEILLLRWWEDRTLFGLRCLEIDPSYRRFNTKNLQYHLFDRNCFNTKDLQPRITNRFSGRGSGSEMLAFARFCVLSGKKKKLDCVFHFYFLRDQRFLFATRDFLAATTDPWTLRKEKKNMQRDKFLIWRWAKCTPWSLNRCRAWCTICAEIVAWCKHAPSNEKFPEQSQAHTD